MDWQDVVTLLAAAVVISSLICAPVFWYRKRAIPDRSRRMRAGARFAKIGGSARKWIRLGIITLGLTAAVPVVLSVASFAYGSTNVAGLFLEITFGLVIALAMLFDVRHSRSQRFFRRLQQEDYLVCPDCHYALTGHRHGGHCPECGYQFTPESLFQDWTDVCRLAWKKPPRPAGSDAVDST
ncbi:MAG: hypothetical protein JXQ73_19450 [Phycisphaerae bacterium]|nr:hypothetical protein [Phycisphaerae bacterium]